MIFWVNDQDQYLLGGACDAAVLRACHHKRDTTTYRALFKMRAELIQKKFLVVSVVLPGYPD